MAGAKPEQQAAALGAVEPAKPQANSCDRPGAGAAADARAIAGTAARAAQRSGGRIGAARGADPGATGGGSTADTTRRVNVAAGARRRDTFYMAVPNMRGPLLVAALAAVFSAMAPCAWADEIQLKDGKKLYGVIVAYEDNMFKVKTDFGYVLVEKDKILKIIPSTPAGKSEPQPTAKKDAGQHSQKPAADSQPQAEPAVASATDALPASTNAGAKLATASTPGKADKSSMKVTSVAVKPE